MRAEREADIDERLVVGLRGGLDGGVVRDDRAEREKRGNRRQQQAQQVRAQAARPLGCASARVFYLYSSSM
jgi:hypothetical protein